MSFNRDKEIRVAFDMSVLGQGVKSGVFRVCDEIIPRLAGRPAVAPFATRRPGKNKKQSDRREKQCKEYMAGKGLDWPWHGDRPSRDVDVLFSPFYAPWAPWASDCGILKVFIAHDLIALRQPHWFENGLAQLVKHTYDSLGGEELIFAISENTKKDLLSYRPDIAPEKIVVAPLAAGEQFFPCQDAGKRAVMRAKYGIPVDAPYFLSLATLEVRKNLDQIVKAFKLFLEEQPDSPACLVLAGMHGWKLDAFTAELDSLGTARNRIILTGFVEEEDLAALYSDALCFVYMSLYEGFGLPPLEAMACGVPVIVSNTSSLPEVVGDAGILLDPHDTDGLCAAMRGILTNAAMRNELAARGLERSRRFSWDQSTAIMMEAIQKELAARSKRSSEALGHEPPHMPHMLETQKASAIYAAARQPWKKLRRSFPDSLRSVLNCIKKRSG